MLKRTLLMAALLAWGGCAEGEAVDYSAMQSAGGSNDTGGQGGVTSNAGGSSAAVATSSGGSNGQSGTSGQSGSDGQSGSNGQSGSGGSAGAPAGDASVGGAGHGGAGGASGAAGSSGSGGSGGSAVMSDAGAIAGFQVLYGNMQTGTPSSYIGCELHAKNGGSSTAAVSELTLRYYFTNDFALAPQFMLNWSHVSTPSSQQNMTVTYTVNPIVPAKNNADTYIEFSLSSPSHTNLSPNESADFSWQIQGPDPSKDKYTQSNDYSWDLGRTQPQQWDHVVLLRNGTVIWGTPP